MENKFTISKTELEYPKIKQAMELGALKRIALKNWVKDIEEKMSYWEWEGILREVGIEDLYY